jgi:aspartyl-tRNA(Asn)/glutamyl-tRNA(Gln) amidotransferase subunit C
MSDKAVIRKVAKIARLDLTDREINSFSRDMNDILKAFKVINKVPTKNVKPAFQPVDVKNVMREDRIEPSLTHEEALANAKQKDQGYFKGPKVV